MTTLPTSKEFMRLRTLLSHVSDCLACRGVNNKIRNLPRNKMVKQVKRRAENSRNRVSSHKIIIRI